MGRSIPNLVPTGSSSIPQRGHLPDAHGDMAALMAGVMAAAIMLMR